MKLYLNNFAELISVLVAIVYYPYLKRTYMKWVLPFLLIVFFGELYTKYKGYILGEDTVGPNYLIAIAESVFYGYVFYYLSRKRIVKTGIFILVSISIAGYILSFLYSPKDHDLLYLNLVVSGLILSVVSLVYLYFRFLDDDHVYIIKEPEFWISFGVSIFFSGVCIVFSLHDIIIKYDLKMIGLKLHHIVPRVLSVVLYLSISIAIILCKKKTRISL